MVSSGGWCMKVGARILNIEPEGLNIESDCVLIYVSVCILILDVYSHNLLLA